MSPNSILQFEGLFFSIFVSFLSLAISTDPEFGDCLPKYCGKHLIKYPFWLQGEHPSYCGYPVFELTCINSSTPVLVNYDEVRTIFYANNSFWAVNSKFLTENCSVAHYNFTTNFNLTPFRVSATNKKLFFFSNCSSALNETGYYPTCEKNTYAYLGGNYTDGGGPSNPSENCKNIVVVPVLGFKGADGDDYERLRHDGFLLEWTVADCSPCLESKGLCGYDNSSNSFMCLCADRSHSESCGTDNKSKLWIIITTASLASLICLSLICFLWIKRRRRSDSREEKAEIHDAETNEASILLRSQNSNSEFSLYNFSEIAEATNHFSPENKLGEGGFGPVYKGQLPRGIDIAAKRLSAYSGQGLVEFKNEIQLIAKLQHRNLVSLIGRCIEGEEKILIYECMPNKSLDFFLFDQTKGALLDWSKRFHIIEGIAQGLLYLHKHSRLRIIHRDLKVSNILLDNDMNPKISDFGMARIFGSNEIQANTNRVVGTYGYMSPEYAFEGVFSIKSDVFSFGVLLLEIVSGKKNAGFHQYGSSLNLLGYTWELWKEGKWSEIVDTSLGDGYRRDEIMRCIHAALMCVQENPTDRPTMSNVIAMLSSESSSFPIPKQPAFFNLRTTSEAEEMVDQGEPNSSINNITVTAPYGR